MTRLSQSALTPDFSLVFDPDINADFLFSSESISISPPQDSNIAPWLVAEEEEPPTPPPKSGHRFIPNKASFSSFVSGSSNRSNRCGRPSETFSFDSTSETTESRKPKSINLLSNMIKKKRSQSRLREDPSSSSIQSEPPPPLPPLPTSFLPLSKMERSKGKKKTSNISNGSSSTLSLGHYTQPSHKHPPVEPLFRLDTNLERMEGIVDLKQNRGPDSSSSGVESSYFSDTSIQTFPGAALTFSDPFSPGAAVAKRRKFERRVAPNAVLPEINLPPAIDGGVPSWEAPESWAVEKEGDDNQEPEYYSSDDDLAAAPSSSNPASNRRSRRKTVMPRSTPKQMFFNKPFKIRIYRANGTYHVVSIGLSVTVSDLTSQLIKRLLLDPERETHRLYLKERGRERMLALSERPADIVRRRLEQAGYTFADGLDMLGTEDMRFLMTFVYKSNLLGPAEEEITFEDFEYVDLTGRSLKTVPVVLHQQADSIIVLNLSRNPMLEIPLDFVQACTNLRDLRLSYMAMKKVPQSVRHCTALQRLDLSCNRIVDLDDAGLDRLLELTTLKVQNNRMERLPWYFSRLQSLKYLNISNNKFKQLPTEVTGVEGLLDLDVSFNMISELPEQIGNLRLLEKLVIIGNQVSRFPHQCSNLLSLRILDCRRNDISDLTAVCRLPRLDILLADHNSVHSFELCLGPSVTEIDASHNDVTQLTVVPGPIGQSYALLSLDVSHAKLSSIDNLALAHLASLQSLKLDHNSIRIIPDSIGDLSRLVTLSCSNNQLTKLPCSIGRLQKLENLDLHNNSITEIPVALWNCASLCLINFTSNMISVWWEPSIPAGAVPAASDPSVPPARMGSVSVERKSSESGSMKNGHLAPARVLPPLAYSLERLYLGENKLMDEALDMLTFMKELRVLNLSFNQIQELPPTFFRNLLNLEELYLSGNHLSSLPTDDLHRLTRLQVLFLNGNKLQTLPQELGRVQSLTALDVGSNVLKYNINNWEFDWNWNFNQNLRYLNLSGNKRLEIKPDATQKLNKANQPKLLADFSSLVHLRVLGLMDVTTIFVPTIPEENEDRRVRTSFSEVNKMAYGIADTLGKTDHVTMFDLVQPEFRDRKNEAVFAMFGRSQPIASNNRLSKFLHDQFISVFTENLETLDVSKGETIPDALRRTFLRLNKLMYDYLSSSSYNSRKLSYTSSSTVPLSSSAVLEKSSGRSGACGIVLYLVDKTLYVANAGNALAVVSRPGQEISLSRKHDPFERSETARIRSAEGWVSPKGCVNDEIDISRSFGFFHLLPVVNACPNVCSWEMNELDEFVIMGNRGLWDFVSIETAVDIARSEIADPMIAAQKLRDFAISYGADGSTMIMVIKVSDLFNTRARDRLPTAESLDSDGFSSARKIPRYQGINNLPISRLGDEIEPPTGHVALVFTDIRNSTHLWEVNAGMPTAMIYHNNLLRRQLRFCSGYEFKTEGDAFMCSFPTVLNALWWCLSVQIELLNLDWPRELLECEDGKEIRDEGGRLVARGLSVRMGIHCGSPVCEPDPVTGRMDYFGPMVNRSARISGSAAGGQIMVSNDIVREINAKVFETESETEYSYLQPPQVVEAVRTIGVVVEPVGEVKLKGLEVPVMLSIVYPRDLAGRSNMDELLAKSNRPNSAVPFTADQVRALTVLCMRFEALTEGKIFHPLPERKGSAPIGSVDESQSESSPMHYSLDPKALLPSFDKTTEEDLLNVMGSVTLRLENAVKLLKLQQLTGKGVFNTDGSFNSLSLRGSIDERTLSRLFAVLDTL